MLGSKEAERLIQGKAYLPFIISAWIKGDTAERRE